MGKPLVSIIVTTKNEETVIERFCQSVVKQMYPRVELILVDNYSTDRTVEIVRQYTSKIFLKGPERSTQRNFGVEKSKGEYVLILDADMELNEKVVEECVRLLERDKNLAAAVIPEDSMAQTFWEKVKAFERSFYKLEGGEVAQAARFFRKEVFLQVGGYDETITGPEDWDLPETIKKSGFGIGKISAVIYHHEKIPSLWSLAKKKYYYGLKVHRYLKKQRISSMSAKTIYFLRPIFYKNWRKLLSCPVLTAAMFVMFWVELAAGGLGFLRGKIKNL